MKFTPEQLTKAKAAKSAEELLALAKENGIELTEEEANKYFADFHKEGEIADSELDNVSGGCGGSSTPSPKYKVGQTFRRIIGLSVDCGEITYIYDYDKTNGYLYRLRSNMIGEYTAYLEKSSDYIFD